LFNSISGEGADPFYPVATASDPDATAEKVDWCQAHPQIAGIFHYHSASPCIADAATYEAKLATGRNTDDIKTQMQTAWQAKPDSDVLGIAKDGRPIMTPYHNNLQSYGDCEVDVCNGMMIGGNYMYVSTFFHPYVMGCYGKGSAPELYQGCSANPRLCNAVYNSALASIGPVSLFAAGALLVSQTLY